MVLKVSHWSFHALHIYGQLRFSKIFEKKIQKFCLSPRLFNVIKLFVQFDSKSHRTLILLGGRQTYLKTLINNVFPGSAKAIILWEWNCANILFSFERNFLSQGVEKAILCCNNELFSQKEKIVRADCRVRWLLLSSIYCTLGIALIISYPLLLSNFLFAQIQIRAREQIQRQIWIR